MNLRQILALVRIQLAYGRQLKHLYPEAGRVSVDFTYSPLTDLRPLRGIALHQLGLYGTAVTDFTELKHLDFLQLNAGGTPFADLSVLQGKRLTSLELYRTPVASLRGIETMPLTFLQLGETRVRDFSPLADLPLHTLLMLYCEAGDLSFLAGLNLERFGFSFTPGTRGLEVLRGMTKLRRVHTTEYDSFSTEEFWHRIENRLPLDENRASFRGAG